MQRDIENLDDIKVLVDEFYGKVRQDELLKNIFEEVIQDRWPQHLEKMYRFWQTVLLGKHTYKGSPFPPHSHLPVDAEHFNRWVKLWIQTVKRHYTGKRADKAIWQGTRMAEMFQSKIQFINK